MKEYNEVKQWYANRINKQVEELDEFDAFVAKVAWEYAEQQVKLLATPAVSKSVCDTCTAYPFDKRGETPLCKNCEDNPKQTGH